MRASDIHIDPAETHVRVRMRVDGVLQNIAIIPKGIHNEVISRIKVLSGLRTDEHAASQDGRFRIIPNGVEAVDVRVSIAPTYHGENAVLRLLTDRASEFNLSALGFSESDRKKIEAAAKKTTGMILSTGPTGSGKTTTLYTLIKMLNTPDVSIVTIEDPIEYAVSDIEQIQVNPVAGLTFANGLRSILRQDPNIIMVGEIRDPETASIAVNTALTGHLVLSTLHTNDAATTLPRLAEMRIEPYLVASTVTLAIGQRLIRRICANCKVQKAISGAERDALIAALPPLALPEDAKLYHGTGCEECVQTGFRGRVGVNEVLEMTPEIREAILKKASATDIKELAIKGGMTTMLEDGIVKALQGDTTIEEVLRVIHD
jgi:type II secretory ATPase GspE/PulE/Tfp pilus assembly ATPase PilB-like protein